MRVQRQRHPHKINFTDLHTIWDFILNSYTKELRSDKQSIYGGGSALSKINYYSIFHVYFVHHIVLSKVRRLAINNLQSASLIEPLSSDAPT